MRRRLERANLSNKYLEPAKRVNKKSFISLVRSRSTCTLLAAKMRPVSKKMVLEHGDQCTQYLTFGIGLLVIRVFGPFKEA